MRSTNRSFGRLGVAALAAVSLCGPLSARAEEKAPVRSPANGLAVVDCTAAPPAPKATCTLRIPPLNERGEMRQVEASTADTGFEFIRDNDPRFPDGVHLSATMILIDQTPGPGKQRLARFPLEKELIADLVKGLPADELVAAYAFDEARTLHPLADFGQSTASVSAAVATLKTDGVNTHIASNLIDAITVLSNRKDILFKNIIVISDGEEEGLVVTDEVHKAAIAANVAISTLGMYWRPSGSAEIGRAKDYLESRLTTPDFGVSEGANLSSPAAARKSVAQFVQRYTTAITRSGLIVPVGGGIETDLVVETIAPEIGNPGATRKIEHRVHFTPAKSDADAAEPKPSAAAEPAQDLLWGYPRLWVYGGAAGAGALLLLILLGLLIGRRRTARHDVAEADPIPHLADGPATSFGSPAPKARPIATLVRDDTRERFAISATGASIGRAPTNDLVLSDESISRIHAELRLVRGVLTLTDAGSLNGTFVNGKRITAATKVKAGDSIGFGDVSTKLLVS